MAFEDLRRNTQAHIYSEVHKRLPTHQLHIYTKTAGKYKHSCTFLHIQILIYTKYKQHMHKINIKYIFEHTQLFLDFICIHIEFEIASPSIVSDSWRPRGLWPTRPLFHGILQARTLEWVATSFSRGSYWPRDWTCVSCSASRFFTTWATYNIKKNVMHKCRHPIMNVP